MNNEEVEAVVLEVSNVDVSYLKFDNQGGPTYILPISEIRKITYQNGSVDEFNTLNDDYDYSMSEKNNLNDGRSMGVRGQQDAIIFYKNYKVAGITTLVVGLISPLIGLIPAITTSATRPKEKNLGIPDRDLIRNRDYVKSYKTEAKKIKQRKVWTFWGISLGVNLAVIIVLSAQ